MLAAQASDSTVINNTTYRTAGKYHSVTNANTATLFIGGRLDELMHNSFDPIKPLLPITVKSYLFGYCYRKLSVSSTKLIGKINNLSYVSRLIRA